MKIRKFMQSFRLMTVIAAAAGFVACQENTVDTQGEILPKLATDAQNTYVAHYKRACPRTLLSMSVPILHGELRLIAARVSPSVRGVRFRLR